MEENKKGKGLTILLLVLLLLLVGALCFGGYKYLSLDKDYKKISNENKSIAEELNKQKEKSEQASTSNDYNLFVKKMKEERAKLNTSNKSSKTTISFEETTSNWAVDNLPIYSVSLSNDGILSVGPNNDSRPITEIAKNVLFYKLVASGNGGFRSLYYVTEDGKVYVSDIENALLYNKAIKSKQIEGLSNIVNILPATVENQQGENAVADRTVYFVDINGNIIHE